jgi:2-iminobutanoate/2-iminopropanoate deaminase
MKQWVISVPEEFEPMTKHLIRAALALLLTAPFALHAQNKAIDFNPKMPFSDGFIAGNTLYVAGQQGPDDNGKVTGTTIEFQTERTIAAIQRIVEKAGFKMTDLVNVTVYVTDLNDVPKMNDVYKRLMPNPKPARATVKVAGLIGDAKIEISAIAVKQ